METHKTIIMWIIAGCILGGVIFLLFQPPATQTTPYVPVQNTSPTPPQQNTTIPPAPQPPQPLPPAVQSINITLIESSDCSLCNSADLLLPQTLTYLQNSTNLTVGSISNITSTSAEGQLLIDKYNITELPSMVISGDPAADSNFQSVWTSSIGNQEGDGSFVSRNDYPPYYNVPNKTVVGLVQGIAINATGCTKCLDASRYLSSLMDPTIGMYFSNQTVLQSNDTQALALIKEYNITELPTLLLSSDVQSYPIYAQMKTLGDSENGWFVLRVVRPPYVDLKANGTIRGLVRGVMIVNESCTNCFNVSSLSDYIAQSAGISVINSTTYLSNSSEAAVLISKYNLTALPALLYSPDLSYYPMFNGTWLNQSNTIESDGWYVFRAYNLISVPYQNITH